MCFCPFASHCRIQLAQTGTMTYSGDCSFKGSIGTLCASGTCETGYAIGKLDTSQKFRRYHASRYLSAQCAGMQNFPSSGQGGSGLFSTGNN